MVVGDEQENENNSPASRRVDSSEGMLLEMRDYRSTPADPASSFCSIKQSDRGHSPSASKEPPTSCHYSVTPPLLGAVYWTLMHIQSRNLLNNPKKRQQNQKKKTHSVWCTQRRNQFHTNHQSWIMEFIVRGVRISGRWQMIIQLLLLIRGS